jgi:MoxR-like ATPase
LIAPQQLNAAADVAQAVIDGLDRMLLGRSDLHRLVIVGLLARGHLLLEGLPGLGKTALIKALGELMRLDFKRIQFTPDLMPGDIIGAHILQETPDGRREFRHQPGPIFTHILLADEINRASPKTQAAMLEAMAERSVTSLGVTRPLPDPFFVLASQNPIELEGTYPLPEAQLDRFLFKLNVGQIDASVLEQIIATRRQGRTPAVDPVADHAGLSTLFAAMERMFLPRPVASFISRLVAATHAASPDAPEVVRQYVSYGASPRAAIGIAEASRGMALLHRRPTVGFEDVRAVAPAVLHHRLILNYKARFDGVDPASIVDQLLAGVDEAGLGLPADVRVVRS